MTDQAEEAAKRIRDTCMDKYNPSTEAEKMLAEAYGNKGYMPDAHAAVARAYLNLRDWDQEFFALSFAERARAEKAEAAVAELAAVLEDVRDNVVKKHGLTHFEVAIDTVLVKYKKVT